MVTSLTKILIMLMILLFEHFSSLTQVTEVTEVTEINPELSGDNFIVIAYLVITVALNIPGIELINTVKVIFVISLKIDLILNF